MTRCPHCGHVGERFFRWHVYRNGTRHIRAECGHCGRWLGSARQTPENVALADRRSTGSNLVGFLVKLDDLGLDLTNRNGYLGLVPRSGAGRPGGPVPREVWNELKGHSGILRSLVKQERRQQAG